MLTYSPGDSLAHRLDPRTKLLVQFAFVGAAFAHETPRGLLVLSGVTAALLSSSGLSPLSALRGYRFVLPFLAAGPLVSALTLGPPWVVFADAIDPALASYRALLVLFVTAAYVRSTPVRETRAAVQRTVPGKFGQFLGTGIALVFRFFPLLLSDLRRTREAMAARLGDERPVVERIELTAIAGLGRAFGRADRLSLALRARCFAWNPTLPMLRFARLDWLGFTVAAVLAAWAVV
ncbi:energy-coupling factor transporter transmembrane component T family protein [Haloprofundus halophilus]|uniref:energy-coupling factor transporter transmembrane component T family protein n=1 Tax=Haloprofundus halophilus TaxID=2283527 RepID=UPI000E42FFDD|nr:energy-coupling factor transporter transmembrane protein EcfT [Haloprofundus halophilus]